MGDKYGDNRIIESLMQRQPQPQSLMVAAPINEVLAVAFMASRRTDVTPSDAVAWAGEILLEAVKQNKSLQVSLREAMLNNA